MRACADSESHLDAAESTTCAKSAAANRASAGQNVAESCAAAASTAHCMSSAYPTAINAETQRVAQSAHTNRTSRPQTEITQRRSLT